MAGLRAMFGGSGTETSGPAIANNSNSLGMVARNQPDGQTSKFYGLEGYVATDPQRQLRLSYSDGRAATYAEVGRVYHINHPIDNEINQRVVVIFRTNNDSWSCYGFCKHPDQDDCKNLDFKLEHIKVVAGGPVRIQIRGSMPRIAFAPHDTGGSSLELSSDLYINCRQIFDIKHTVKVAPLGSLDSQSLERLLRTGREVFLNTFGDLDKE